MTNTNSFRGKKGEQQACAYLSHIGYQILATNFHSRFGEIDIIARDDNTIVFVEVKCFSVSNYIPPHFAISHAKKQKIIKTAQTYLQKTGLEHSCRFDAVLITGDSIEHIPGAFTI